MVLLATSAAAAARLLRGGARHGSPKGSKRCRSRRTKTITAIANDFVLLDSWSLPVGIEARVGRSFEDFVGMLVSEEFRTSESAARESALARLRFWLGRSLHWDESNAGSPIPGTNEDDVRTRLAPDDVARNRVSTLPASDGERGIVPIYLFEDEALFEIVNGTVHALLHFTVGDDTHDRRVALAIYVKSRGTLGELYLAAIRPFRRRLVHPALFEAIGSAWAKGSPR